MSADIVTRANKVAGNLGLAAIGPMRVALHECVAEITRLRAELAVKDGAVVVKALKWHDQLSEYIAITPIGVYRIDLQNYWFSPLGVGGSAKSRQEAKAAAQQDYEQRIRSSLVSAPSVKDGALSDALRELAQLKIGNRVLDALVAEKCALLLAAEARASAAEAREAGLRAALELFACDCTGRCEVQQSWPAMAKGCARAQARVLLRARAALSPETQVEPDRFTAENLGLPIKRVVVSGPAVDALAGRKESDDAKPFCAAETQARAPIGERS